MSRFKKSWALSCKQKQNWGDNGACSVEDHSAGCHHIVKNFAISVSEGRNEEILAPVVRNTTLTETIFQNLSLATVNQSMSRLLSGRDSMNNSKKGPPFNTHLDVESKAFLILKCSIAHPRIWELCIKKGKELYKMFDWEKEIIK